MYAWVLVSEGDATNVAFPCMVLLADEFPQSQARLITSIHLAIDRVCHSINGPGISGPGGPFMLNIIGPPGPLMPKHKWSY